MDPESVVRPVLTRMAYPASRLLCGWFDTIQLRTLLLILRIYYGWQSFWHQRFVVS
jgi:hypothetical protein